MITKLFKLIVTLVLSALCLLIFMWIYASSQSHEVKSDPNAMPYVHKAIKDISGWDSQVFQGYMAPESKKAFTSSDFDNLVSQLSKLGKLEQIAAPQFTKTFSKSSITSLFSGATEFRAYAIPVKYENAEAKIEITIKSTENGYEVYQYQVSSPFLFK